jgi:hypothetical protein
MKDTLKLIPKVIAMVIVATATWLVYTNMQPAVAPEESAVTQDASGESSGITGQETAAGSPQTQWVSGYSLTEKNNTMVIPTRKREKSTNEETDSSATDNSNTSTTE